MGFASPPGGGSQYGIHGGSSSGTEPDGGVAAEEEAPQAAAMPTGIEYDADSGRVFDVRSGQRIYIGRITF
eukprot:12935204-Prorocentrum_lima.AAC.1